MKYEIALVIGNGFDLNLGLKTSYSDYLESKEFKKLQSSSNEKSLASQLYNTYKYKSHTKNWIDLELYLKTFYAEDSQFHKSRSEFVNLVDNIGDYLTNIKNAEKDTILNIQSYKVLSKIVDLNFIILNFNYTDTLSAVLKELNVSQKKIKTNVINVHGSLKDNNIIVGVDESFIQKKQTSFLRKASNENYINNDINEIFENSENVIFFGHSFGETDHSYFDDFFQEAAKKRLETEKGIIIFYHGSDDWYNKTYELSKLTKDRFKKLMDFNKFSKFDTSKKNGFNFIEDFLVEKEIEGFKIR